MITFLYTLALLLSVDEVSAFSLPSHHVFRTAAVRSSVSTTALLYYSEPSLLNDTLANNEVASFIPPPFLWNNTLASLQADELAGHSQGALVSDRNVVDDQQQEQQPSPAEIKRSKLKRELAHAAITGYEEENGTDNNQLTCRRTAEDIMKELEQLSSLPILRPASHHSLNANWSFVFTGVPTIGMRLITLLSRISVLFPFEILDFRNVALNVENEQTKAKALVEVQLCGSVDLVLEVCTSLRPPTEEDLIGEYKEFRGEKGTLLLEHFQGIKLNGITIPTPQSWSTTRTLEISYMDKDILIARTSGGEPHLLLRNSPLCYTPEDMMTHVVSDETDMIDEIEECNLDEPNAWTEFFSDAVEMYGERITRCLVDRDFGKEEMKNQLDGADEYWWKSISSGIKLGQQWGVGDDDK